MQKRILIIEDEREVSLILRKRLQVHKYEVLEAFDGQQGLEMAKGCKPDLILLDLVLPKMGGAEILEELKADERYRDIPIVVVTGLTPDTFATKASLAKADAYFLKPYDSVELMAAITDLLKSSPS